MERAGLQLPPGVTFVVEPVGYLAMVALERGGGDRHRLRWRSEGGLPGRRAVHHPAHRDGVGRDGRHRLEQAGRRQRPGSSALAGRRLHGPLASAAEPVRRRPRGRADRGGSREASCAGRCRAPAHPPCSRRRQTSRDSDCAPPDGRGGEGAGLERPWLGSAGRRGPASESSRSASQHSWERPTGSPPAPARPRCTWPCSRREWGRGTR